MTGLETTVRHLRDRAEDARERAAAASTPALREYYRGRADAAQAAADAFRKYVYKPTDYDAFIARATDGNLESEDEEAP